MQISGSKNNPQIETLDHELLIVLRELVRSNNSMKLALNKYNILLCKTILRLLQRVLLILLVFAEGLFHLMVLIFTVFFRNAVYCLQDCFFVR